MPELTIDDAARFAASAKTAGPGRWGRVFRRYALAYGLIAPALILLGLLILYPLGDAIYLSLTRTSFISPKPIYVGLSNYRNLLSDPIFHEVLVNSLVWTVGVVVFQFVIGMGTALLLNQHFVGRSLMRALVIVPWVMPGIVGGLLWSLLYDPYLGLVNRILVGSGILHHYIPWLAQPSTVMGAIIFAAIWKGAPFSTLMYMAAYQNVSQDLLEAAQLDGANWWQRLRSVIVAEMAPTIRTTILLTTVWTFNYFDLIYVMTKGGPGMSSQIFPTYIYQLAFVNVQYGLAATYGIVSVVILTIFSALYIHELNRAEVFES